MLFCCLQAWVISFQACIHAARRNESRRDLEIKEKRETELAKQLSGNQAAFNGSFVVGDGENKVKYLPADANGNSVGYMSAYAPADAASAPAADVAGNNNHPFAGQYVMPSNNQYAPVVDDPFEVSNNNSAISDTSSPHAPALSIDASRSIPPDNSSTLAPSAPSHPMDSPLPVHNADVESEEEKGNDDDGEGLCVVCQGMYLLCCSCRRKCPA